MKVTTYGTRGSLPISNKDSVQFGGNTTCLRILSDRIPKDSALLVDAGSGAKPACGEILKQGIKNICVLFTHWHHDHTQGLLMAPHTFIPFCRMKLIGPNIDKVSTPEVFHDVMKPPYFPMDFSRVKHTKECITLKEIATEVMVVHPEGGITLVSKPAFDAAEVKGQVTIKKRHFPVDECLVVKMYKTHHPEYAVSYRFEDRTTGEVFVFLTDHENTSELPNELIDHVKDADLLIQDCQYSLNQYRVHTAGFGHGTPDYCVKVMLEAGVKQLGLTHHDTDSTDTDIKKRLMEAWGFYTHYTGKVPINGFFDLELQIIHELLQELKQDRENDEKEGKFFNEKPESRLIPVFEKYLEQDSELVDPELDDSELCEEGNSKRYPGSFDKKIIFACEDYQEIAVAK